MDNGGNFFITLEQNAKASGSNYGSDGNLFSDIKERYWKQFPKIQVFEEGYNKDYIYEKGIIIPSLNNTNNKFDFMFNMKSNSDNISKRGGRRHIILLTMRGAIKFNMWKRTEGGKISNIIFVSIFFELFHIFGT